MKKWIGLTFLGLFIITVSATLALSAGEDLRILPAPKFIDLNVTLTWTSCLTEIGRETQCRVADRFLSRTEIVLQDTLNGSAKEVASGSKVIQFGPGDGTVRARIDATWYEGEGFRIRFQTEDHVNINPTGTVSVWVEKMENLNRMALSGQFSQTRSDGALSEASYTVHFE